MKIFLSALVFFGLSYGVALAQDSMALNGNWLASFESGKNSERQAQVVIGDAGGSWLESSVTTGDFKGRNNPCLGKTFPITIKSRTSTEISFQVNASTTMQGCSDRKITATSSDNKTLDGSFNNGSPVKLVRQ
jgi:hypothetical protein